MLQEAEEIALELSAVHALRSDFDLYALVEDAMLQGRQLQHQGRSALPRFEAEAYLLKALLRFQ